MTNPSQQFADRLVALESDRDVDAFVSALFAEDVTLHRPETGRELSGRDGAVRFWTEYLDQFQQVRSDFARVQHGEVGVLEWTSRGSLPTGADIAYAGVSLLDFDDQDRVTRFATYYDTAAFQPAPRA